MVLEKTLENPLYCKIKPVNPKGNQSWIFIGRTDAEAEIPILWPPDAKNWLIWKDPYAGKGRDGGDRGWDGWMASLTWWTWVWASSWSWWWKGSLAWCSPWVHKESDTTEQLNWIEISIKKSCFLETVHLSSPGEAKKKRFCFFVITLNFNRLGCWQFHDILSICQPWHDQTVNPCSQDQRRERFLLKAWLLEME